MAVLRAGLIPGQLWVQLRRLTGVRSVQLVSVGNAVRGGLTCQTGHVRYGSTFGGASMGVTLRSQRQSPLAHLIVVVAWRVVRPRCDVTEPHAVFPFHR